LEQALLSPAEEAVASSAILIVMAISVSTPVLEPLLPVPSSLAIFLLSSYSPSNFC